MAEKCNKCGAKIEFSPNQQSLVCSYCGATNKIDRKEDIVDVDIDVDLVIPFSISKDDLEKKVYALMAEGDYAPDDMLDSAKFLKQEQIYVPVYYFKVKYEAQWSATFGYDREEHYTDYVSNYRDGRWKKEPVTKTKVVTDWRPINGTDSGIFDMFSYAGDLLNQSPLQPKSLVDHCFEVGKPTKFKKSFTEGIQIETFTVSESNAFDSEKDQLNNLIDIRVKNHAQGDHQRDWHWNATHSNSASTILIPICHAVFDYEGEEYHVWTDGVDCSGIIADKFAEDQNRKKHVLFGFIPFTVALLSALIVSGFKIETLSLITIIAALFYGLLRRYYILEYSKKIRSSLLTQMEVSATNTAKLSAEEKENMAKAFQRPDKSVLANISHDKYVIPTLTLFFLLGAILPGYLSSESTQSNTSSPEIQTQALPQSVQTAPEPKQDSHQEIQTIPESIQSAPEPEPEPEPEPIKSVPKSVPSSPEQSQQSQKIIELYNQASNAYRRKEFDKALTYLEIAKGIEPNNLQIHQAIEKVKREQIEAIHNLEIK
jgi:hypothetical protein